MKFTVRAARLNTTNPDPANLYTEGEIIGIITAESPYEGAVEASKKFFKAGEFPFRETGWPNQGGLFFTARRPNDGARVKDKPFFLRIGR